MYWNIWFNNSQTVLEASFHQYVELYWCMKYLLKYQRKCPVVVIIFGAYTTPSYNLVMGTVIKGEVFHRCRPSLWSEFSFINIPVENIGSIFVSDKKRFLFNMFYFKRHYIWLCNFRLRFQLSTFECFYFLVTRTHCRRNQRRQWYSRNCNRTWLFQCTVRHRWWFVFGKPQGEFNGHLCRKNEFYED